MILAAPCEANVMRQPAGRLTAPLPSGNRVVVSVGTTPEFALPDVGDGVDAVLQASVSVCRSVCSLEAKCLESSYRTAAAGLVPLAIETMTRPAILLLAWVLAVTVKKAPKFWPSRDSNTLPTTGLSPKC